MKKLFAILVVALLIAGGGIGLAAGDKEEVVALKKSLAQERVMRIQAEMELLRQRFADGQRQLQQAQKDLADIQAQEDKNAKPAAIKEDVK